MFDWLQSKLGRGTHPMRGPAEAARLLAELPVDDPLKALEEVAAWLESLARATSAHTGNRMRVIMMVDEAGQPSAEALLAACLAPEGANAPDRYRAWQTLADFWQRLADAYAYLVALHEAAPRAELAESMPVLVVRGLRALATQRRVAHMRRAAEAGSGWDGLYRLFRFAHERRIAATPVRPYPWDTLATTARLELVRTVMLEAAAPQSLTARQIELAARVAARFASSFAFAETPSVQHTVCLDLAQTRPPAATPPDLKPLPTMRFFGPGAVQARLKEVLDGEQAGAPGANLFGEEFTRAERADALRRLAKYWSDHPPRRADARTRHASSVEVVFGLPEICKVIDTLEQTIIADESDALNVQFDDDEQARRETSPVAERWQLVDLSLHGLGAVAPRRAGGALRVGALVAFRLDAAEAWCVGALRRLQSEGPSSCRVGVEIFSRKPQLLWLKKFGLRENDAWDWETRDKQFSGLYAQAVWLGADPEGGRGDQIVLAPRSYGAEETFGTMIAKRPRKLQLGEADEETGDFARLAFRWLDEAPAGAR